MATFEILVEQFCVFCHRCRRDGPTRPTQAAAKKAALLQGWLKLPDGVRFLCPHCQRNHK